ncbi:MAG: nitroreductase/quinone reductase family protein [Pseudomonadota bacterium]
MAETGTTTETTEDVADLGKPSVGCSNDDSLLLVASQGGAPKHPVCVEEGGRRRPLRARELSLEEKAEVWSVCVAHYGSYADYQKRTTRPIPVFRCEPSS